MIEIPSDQLEETFITKVTIINPTPEQYREEFGEEVPDGMAVWCHREGVVPMWCISKYGREKECYLAGESLVVVAFAPFPSLTMTGGRNDIYFT